MIIFNINYFTIIIVVIVNVFNNCYGHYGPEYELCRKEITNKFQIERKRPSRKTYASYAFINMRADDDAFWSESTTSEYAKKFYLEIFTGGYIKPGEDMKTPSEYCHSKPKIKFEAYYDHNLDKNITDPVVAQMSANSISLNGEKQHVINHIYENIVVDNLDEFYCKYVIDYIWKCEKKMIASRKTITPHQFCMNITTQVEPNLNLGLGV